MPTLRPWRRRANEWEPQHPTSCPCSDKGGRVEAFTSPCFSARGAVTPLRCQALVSYFWSLLRDSWVTYKSCVFGLFFSHPTKCVLRWRETWASPLFCLYWGPLMLADLLSSPKVYSEGWHSRPLSIALEMVQCMRYPAHTPLTIPCTLAQSCIHSERGCPLLTSSMGPCRIEVALLPLAVSANRKGKLTPPTFVLYNIFSPTFL